MDKKFLLTGTILIIIYKVVNNLGEVLRWMGEIFDLLFPCIFGAIIALFLYVPCRKIRGILDRMLGGGTKKYSGVTSILCVYALIFGTLCFVAVYFAPGIYHNTSQLIKNIPGYVEMAEGFIEENKYLKNLNLNTVLNTGSYFSLDKFSSLMGIVKGIADSFISVFLGVVISIYLLIDAEGIKTKLQKINRKFFEGRVYRAALKLQKVISLVCAYFSGLLFDAIIVATMVSVGLKIMDMPYFLLLGAIAGVGNIIPFFGTAFSVAGIGTIALISGGVWKLLWVIVYLVSVLIIDGNVIQPRITGKSVGLSPLEVLVSVIIFGGIFGWIGMLIGVPVGAAIKMYLTEYSENQS